jgi:hypothetical protein
MLPENNCAVELNNLMREIFPRPLVDVHALQIGCPEAQFRRDQLASG